MIGRKRTSRCPKLGGLPESVKQQQYKDVRASAKVTATRNGGRQARIEERRTVGRETACGPQKRLEKVHVSGHRCPPSERDVVGRPYRIDVRHRGARVG